VIVNFFILQIGSDEAMNAKIRHFYLFLFACSGNWRNTVYIPGKQDNAACLIAADWDGKPVIMSVGQFQRLSGTQIDPDECCRQLTPSAFQDIYAQYLHWQFPDDRADVLAALSRSPRQ